MGQGAAQGIQGLGGGVVIGVGLADGLAIGVVAQAEGLALGAGDGRYAVEAVDDGAALSARLPAASFALVLVRLPKPSSV